MEHTVSKKIVKIGYYGYSPKEKPEHYEILKSRFQNHRLFDNKDVQLFYEDSLETLLSNFHKGVYDYVSILTRNDENEITASFLSLMSRLTIEKINEIGSVTVPITYFSKKVIKSPDAASSVVYKDTEDYVEYLFSEDNCKTDQLEYRIFKKSQYKTPFKKKLWIWSYLNNSFKLVFNIITILLAILVIVLTIVKQFVEVFADNSFIIEAIASSLILVLQGILATSKFDSKAKKSMVEGYWLYYSFEETTEKNTFVPKGFKTRLIKIDEDGDTLSLKCYFAGEDIVFFSTDVMNLDYYPSEKMVKGFYYYSSNISNNNGKRAEGMCRFEGAIQGANQLESMNGWFFSRGTRLTGRVRFFRITEEDFNLINSSISFYSLKKKNGIYVGIYGSRYSNTDLFYDSNSDSIFKSTDVRHDEVKKIYFDDIQTLKKYLDVKMIDYAVVPVENRNVLILSNNLFNEEKYEPIYTNDMVIKYVLGSNNKQFKIDKDTIFVSHAESLKQCSEFIGEHQVLTSDSTSKAACDLYEGKYNQNTICICNPQSLELYGLYPVLDDRGNAINPYISKIENKTVFKVFKLK